MSGSLRVVTARELVILSGSFTFHSKSARWLRHLRGHASHERYTVSNVEGQQTNLHRSIPRAPRIEPGAAAWTGTHATTCALALVASCMWHQLDDHVYCEWSGWYRDAWTAAVTCPAPGAPPHSAGHFVFKHSLISTTARFVLSLVTGLTIIIIIIIMIY